MQSNDIDFNCTVKLHTERIELQQKQTNNTQHTHTHTHTHTHCMG